MEKLGHYPVFCSTKKQIFKVRQSFIQTRIALQNSSGLSDSRKRKRVNDELLINDIDTVDS